MKREEYAKVVWTIDDVLDLRPSWNEAQAEEWLIEHQWRIVDVMITRGWEAIEDMLPPPSKEDIEQQS